MDNAFKTDERNARVLMCMWPGVHTHTGGGVGLCVHERLTLLLAPGSALLQQGLAVEGGQGGGCVLLHP